MSGATLGLPSEPRTLMGAGTLPTLKCFASVSRVSAICSDARFTDPVATTRLSSVSRTTVRACAAPSRNTTSAMKHWIRARVGMPSADSRALPNCRPDRSTSNALTLPPLPMYNFSSPLPCARISPSERPVPSMTVRPPILPAPRATPVLASNLSRLTRWKSIVARALTAWALTCARSISPVICPPPIPNASGLRVTAPSTMSRSARIVSSGCARPKMRAALYFRCTSAALRRGRLIGSLGSTRPLEAVARLVPLSASPGSAPMKPARSLRSTSLLVKVAVSTGRPPLSAGGRVSTVRSPSRSVEPILP